MFPQDGTAPYTKTISLGWISYHLSDWIISQGTTIFGWPTALIWLLLIFYLCCYLKDKLCSRALECLRELKEEITKTNGFFCLFFWGALSQRERDSKFCETIKVCTTRKMDDIWNISCTFLPSNGVLYNFAIFLRIIFLFSSQFSWK